MKNFDLNACGVQEMSQKELEDTNGGFIRVVVGLVIAAGAAIINDWDNFKNGLAGRPEEK